MTHSGYWAKQSHSHATFDKSMSSTARDFRQLTPLVVMAALARAGTTVCEPVHAFVMEIPSDTLGATAAALAALRGVPERYEALRGAAPTRPRTDADPLDRTEYIRRVLRQGT